MNSKLLNKSKALNIQLQEVNRELYYEFYHKFETILLKYNPCDFINNQCVSNRINNTANGCCPTCELNTYAGCSILSLGCKMILCSDAKANLPEEVRLEWLKLEALVRELRIYRELRKEFI